MAYHIEGKDIVINGFEQGIADTPYDGIADMRNIEIIGMPREGSVNFEQTPVTVPPVMNAIAFTAQASADTITIASTTGLYNGAAIVLNTNTAGGLSTGTVYYVDNVTATTFQVTLTPFFATPIDISSDGSGTLTTYQFGNQRGVGETSPKSYYSDTVGSMLGVNFVYIIDASNYAWAVSARAVAPFNAYTLIFLGNIAGASTNTANVAVAVWKEYIFIFDEISGVDIAELDSIVTDGPAIAWDYAWKLYDGPSLPPMALVSQEDDNLYFTSDAGLGSLIEQPGESFDPTNSDTYAYTDEALFLPTTDQAVSIAELGAYIYIGGINAFIYPWDKISPGFGTPLVVPETFQTRLVGTDQNLFIFSGNRGRIYISNGASVDLYKKIPDYITGIVNPYFRWRAASFSRGDLIFGFTCTDNAGTVLTSVAGAWGINVETKALRMIVKLTNSGYAGSTNMVVEIPKESIGTANQIIGSGILTGWNVSNTTYGLDRPTSAPYDGTEAYFDTDMIPVGTFLSPFSPSQIEWKTSVPIGNSGTSETISLYYRTSLGDSFTLIGTSTSASGTINGKIALSDLFKANFQKTQWVQLRAVLSSNSTTPTYVRLTEIRIRDYPSTTTGGINP